MNDLELFHGDRCSKPWGVEATTSADRAAARNDADPTGQRGRDGHRGGSVDGRAARYPTIEAGRVRGGPVRLVWLDAARGVLVTAMLIWHSADAWLIPAGHAGLGYSLRLTGALTAPGFLLLAGVAASHHLAVGGRPGRLARRGLEIIALGVLLRAQAWTLDGGAMFDPAAWPTLVGVIATCGLLFRPREGWLARMGGPATRPLRQPLPGVPSGGLRRRPPGRPPPGSATLVGAVAAAAWSVAYFVPHPETGRWLLHTDILHCIGAALMLAALLHTAADTAGLLGDRGTRSSRRLTVQGIRNLEEVPTPAARTAWLAALAFACVLAVAATIDGPNGGGAFASWGYLQVPPDGHGMARFPLLPWVAYLFAGMAVGPWLMGVRGAGEDRDGARTGRSSRSTSRTLPLLACALVALALAWGTSEVYGWQRTLVATSHVPRGAWRVLFRTSAVCGALWLIVALASLPAGKAPGERSHRGVRLSREQHRRLRQRPLGEAAIPTGTRFMTRVGLHIHAVAAGARHVHDALCAVATGAVIPFVTLGRRSLAVYWVHLALTYGVVTRALHHDLTVGTWCALLMALWIVMLGMAHGLSRLNHTAARPKWQANPSSTSS